MLMRRKSTCISLIIPTKKLTNLAHAALAKSVSLAWRQQLLMPPIMQLEFVFVKYQLRLRFCGRNTDDGSEACNQRESLSNRNQIRGDGHRKIPSAQRLHEFNSC